MDYCENCRCTVGCDCRSHEEFTKSAISSVEKYKKLITVNQQQAQTIEKQNKRIAELKKDLIFSHSFILNLMDNWNFLRDVLSNVSTKKYDDGQIEWTDCSDLEMNASDFYKAKRLSENFAMGNFKEWFSEIKEKYKHESLDDHEDFKDQYYRNTERN